jgi:hypothetical protein
MSAWWSGSIDEVRVQNTVRTDGWILTEYNNGNAPASFVTVGALSYAGSVCVSLG